MKNRNKIFVVSTYFGLQILFFCLWILYTYIFNKFVFNAFGQPWEEVNELTGLFCAFVTVLFIFAITQDIIFKKTR